MMAVRVTSSPAARRGQWAARPETAVAIPRRRHGPASPWRPGCPQQGARGGLAPRVLAAPQRHGRGGHPYPWPPAGKANAATAVLWSGRRVRRPGRRFEPMRVVYGRHADRENGFVNGSLPIQLGGSVLVFERAIRLSLCGDRAYY